MRGAREIVYIGGDAVRGVGQLGDLALYGVGAKDSLYKFDYKSKLMKGADEADRNGQLASYSVNVGEGVFKSGVTLGIAPLVETGIQGVKTGDWTDFQEAAGGNLAGLALAKVAKNPNSVFYRERPTYNLGGELRVERPGAVNVQPSSFPGVPETPSLIVQDASALPIRSGSGNIYSQNTGK